MNQVMIDDLFFRGYVELNDNKKAITSYKKGKPLLSYEDALKRDNFAGVLSDDTILIDIDDSDQADIFYKITTDLNINTRVYKTTRGRHFLFKNTNINKCFTHATLALGLTADIKVGVKNTYEVLKYHGEVRTLEKDIDKNTPYDIPFFLHPVPIAPEFLDMKEGDGRNQSLFNYIIVLQNNSYTVDQIKNILSLINKYLLKNPLTDKELNQIMRDEAFLKPVFFDNKRFLHERFANYLRNEYHIKKINGMLHIYVDGLYKPGYREIEAVMIMHIPQLTTSKRNEVLNSLELLCKEQVNMSPANFILFKNGVYDINTDEFLENSAQYIIPNQIPWDYKPDVYSKAVDDVLNNISLNNSKVRALIEEMIGFIMFRRSELGRCFILKGEGANGKSTLLHMIRNLIGKKNASSLDMGMLDDRFSTIMLHNKLANIGDDTSEDYIPTTGIFKKIVTGDTISAEQKGVPKTDFDPYCKLIFSTNNVPRIGKGKDTGAIARRLVIIPFDAKFVKGSSNYKAYIIDDLLNEEAMEYLINLAIKGLKRFIENGEFTSDKTVSDSIEEFKEMNNPALGFFKTLEDENGVPSIDDKSTDDLFMQYNIYCKENNFTPMGKSWFVRELLKYFTDFTVKRVNVHAFDSGKTGKKSIIVKKDKG